MPEAPPAVPTSAIRARVVELGFGSGPWSRGDLAERWGDASTNKFIAEAKDAGWLVSPFRDQYFVPSAPDVMIVSWLPPLQRREFAISRTLSAAGLRFWSLSAWASTEGLLFSEPVFVTDLSPVAPPPAKGAFEPGRSPAAVSKLAQARAQDLKSLPFLENLIIVPVLGRLSDERERSRITLPGPKRARDSPGSPPNVIEYEVTPRMDDAAWLFAFLGALDIPRAREKLRRLAQAELAVSAKRGARGPSPKETMDRAMLWASTFGPPSPNDNWQAVILSGVSPYLLVPRLVWEESLSVASARAFDSMTSLRRSLDA